MTEKICKVQMSETTHQIIKLYAANKKITFPEAAKKLIDMGTDALIKEEP